MKESSVVQSEQEVSASQEHYIRIQKAQELAAKGINPWPEAKTPTATTKQVLDSYDSDAETQQEVQLVGRVMSLRLHGKAAFAHVQDETSRLQVYFKSNTIGAEAFEAIQHYLDLGDIIWVQGVPFTTKRGEITVKVEAWSLQSKCLHPLPEKFHGLTDVEVRYRQRYLDTITNEKSKLRLLQRSKIVQECRNFLIDRDYLEVETPMLHPIAGGAAAKPFITHHNALGDDFYLRIAPELYLKRLVVGGFEKVFELNKNFRNEGISTRHNPEFTMLELYTAHEDYHFGMNLVEHLIKQVVKKVCGEPYVQFGDQELNFAVPFVRMTLKEAVAKHHGLTQESLTEDKVEQLLQQDKITTKKANMSYQEKLYLLFEETVEPALIQPTFITEFPIEVSPLTRALPENAAAAARAELFIAGMEISNLYNELNDPFEQADRFKDQLKAHEDGDDEAHAYDHDYILALQHALPPTVGIGIGVDRLAMIVTNTLSIKDVILFPTLKKK